MDFIILLAISVLQINGFVCINGEKDVVNKKRIKQSSFKKDHINIRHDFKTDFRLSLK